MIRVRAPGKIMIAGEWSVLEIGNSCIVSVVDRSVTATIIQSEQIVFNAPDIGLDAVICSWDGDNLSINNQKNLKQVNPLKWFDKLTTSGFTTPFALSMSKGLPERCQKKRNNFDARFKFCYHAAQTTLQFLQAECINLLNFEITIKSNLSIQDGMSSFLKLGLGSSAAVTVAVCKAILALHGCDIDSNFWQEIIFKLASVAHFIASGKTGSGFDVAAASFESPLVYRRFEPLFLEEGLNSGTPFNALVRMKWPGFYIEKILLPEDLSIVTGFCGVSSSTPELIKKINEFKTTNFDCYKNILNQINEVVLELISALKQKQCQNVLDLIRRNRALLQQLSLMAGIVLEIPELSRMIELAESCGAAAKFSGAGGGDCAIAVTFDKQVARNVRNLWKTCSIPL